MFREVSGERAYVHPTTPADLEIGKFKILAINKLDNLMLDKIPVRLYDDLNTEIVRNISGKRIFNEVFPIQDESELKGDPANSKILLLDGFVDDYDDGSRALRIAELGLNYAVVTIRVNLRDGQTMQVLAAASISVYERGTMKTGKSAVHKAAKTVADFVSKKMSPPKKSHA